MGNLRTWTLTKLSGKATCRSYVSEMLALPVTVPKWLDVFCVQDVLLAATFVTWM